MAVQGAAVLLHGTQHQRVCTPCRGNSDGWKTGVDGSRSTVPPGQDRAGFVQGVMSAFFEVAWMTGPRHSEVIVFRLLTTSLILWDAYPLFREILIWDHETMRVCICDT